MWAVLPLKDFARAKQRLAGVLTACERRRLFQAMVEDVLMVFAQARRLSGCIIVSDEPLAQWLAERYGALAWSEGEAGVEGLNAAVQWAGDCLAREGKTDMLVIHGDVPLATPAMIDELIDNHPADGVTLVADRAGRGTNCLICATDAPLTFCFGDSSHYHHKSMAQAQGLTCRDVDNPALALDIDDPTDLVELMAVLPARSPSHTRKYLHESGIHTRLLTMAIGDQAAAPAQEESL